MPSLETITAAAVMMPDGALYSLPCPKRHHDVIHQIYAATGTQVPGNAEQGFMTSDKRFVSRWEAHRIAIDAGQPCKRPLSEGSELFSEDLW